MIKNVGTIDRVIRIVLGLILLYAAWAMYNTDSLVWAIVSLVVGIYVLITAITGSCFIYKAMGVNTDTSSTPPSNPSV